MFKDKDLKENILVSFSSVRPKGNPIPPNWNPQPHTVAEFHSRERVSLAHDPLRATYLSFGIADGNQDAQNVHK